MFWSRRMLARRAVVLLLVAPLCLLLALFSPANRRALLVIALALLAAGTIGAYLSAATGDAARDSATRSPELAKAIEEHEEIGSVVRAASTVPPSSSPSSSWPPSPSTARLAPTPSGTGP